MTHDNSYMQKTIPTSLPLVPLGCTGQYLLLFIIKPWSNPLEDNEIQLMGCFLSALKNNETEEMIQVIREKYFFILVYILKKYLYVDNTHHAIICISDCGLWSKSLKPVA